MTRAKRLQNFIPYGADITIPKACELYTSRPPPPPPVNEKYSIAYEHKVVKYFLDRYKTRQKKYQHLESDESKETKHSDAPNPIFARLRLSPFFLNREMTPTRVASWILSRRRRKKSPSRNDTPPPGSRPNKITIERNSMMLSL